MTDSAHDELRTRYDEVYRFARRHTLSAAAAEDLTQQAFMEAVASKPGRAGQPDVALLLTIARRRMIDELRRAKFVSASVDELSEARAPRSHLDYARAVSDAIDRLEPRQRELVVLKLLRGLSFAEASKISGVSEAACKMRFRRGMEHLRTDLEERGVEP
jgi:RNA polymerase sigma-70 factor (ECF subfamily)